MALGIMAGLFVLAIVGAVIVVVINDARNRHGAHTSHPYESGHIDGGPLEPDGTGGWVNVSVRRQSHQSPLGDDDRDDRVQNRLLRYPNVGFSPN